MRAAIVKDDEVMDAVELPPDWTGADTEWQPPDGTQAIVSDEAKIGDRYDGETFTTPEPPPPDYSTADWHRMIEERADTELQRGVSVTIGDTTYGIRTGPAALALEVGGTVAAERARAAGKTLTEPVPTDRGVQDFDSEGLDAIFEAVRSHRRAVVERVRELQAMVRDGSIQESDLEQWP